MHIPPSEKSNTYKSSDEEVAELGKKVLLGLDGT